MMFNKASSFLAAALVFSASFVTAAPAPAAANANEGGVKTISPVVNIVYNPFITYPTAGVVWTAGETRTVTWKTDELPEELKNSTGTILLGFNEDGSENLDIAHPLVTGFQLNAGEANVTVPQKSERSDYIVVLFGDSGNASPEFTIKPAMSASVSATASASTPSATGSLDLPF